LVILIQSIALALRSSYRVLSAPGLPKILDGNWFVFSSRHGQNARRFASSRDTVPLRDSAEFCCGAIARHPSNKRLRIPGIYSKRLERTPGTVYFFRPARDFQRFDFSGGN